VVFSSGIPIRAFPMVAVLCGGVRVKAITFPDEARPT